MTVFEVCCSVRFAGWSVFNRDGVGVDVDGVALNFGTSEDRKVGVC